MAWYWIILLILIGIPIGFGLLYCFTLWAIVHMFCDDATPRYKMAESKKQNAFVKVLGWVYLKCLWLAGAALTPDELDELKLTGGDRLTYWMRRSKKRLGVWWWVAVIATIIVMNIRLYTAFRNKQWGWFSFALAFDVLCLWLIPHVCGIAILL